jgi:Uma2 family endonuclease
MATLTIKLPSQRAQADYNLRRWAELIEDPELAKIEGRVETDRIGRVILHSFATAAHGGYQAETGCLLYSLMSQGELITECPISTADGVRAADVAWASPECMKELGNHVCFTRSPEICVEVLSPGNTDAEIQEKMALYFDAGAKEVWLCENSGEMKFFLSPATPSALTSKLCADFPAQIQLH